VRPFCEDGRTFVHHAVKEVLQLTETKTNHVTVRPKRLRNVDPSTTVAKDKIITIPQTVSHFVMNLPATAIDFLDSFSGIYAGHERLFFPYTDTKLPLVHVHCFSTKSDDNKREGIEICQRISEKLGFEIRPGDPELSIHDVRDVAPEKRMFCASFRLPHEVAFRESSASVTSLESQ
jgi:tRNA (guanine37-N1)-methyltransferase